MSVGLNSLSGSYYGANDAGYKRKTPTPSPTNGEHPFSLKTAIKAYRDEKLTGLTDEEREKIDTLSREYLKKHPLKTKADRDAYNAYVKSLLKEYGFKGDLEDFGALMASEEQEKKNK